MNRPFLFAVGIGICASSVLAADPPSVTADANIATEMKIDKRQRLEQQQRFEAIDTNGDGYISEQEAQAQQRLLDSWGDVDLNSDGKIDQSEFSAFETEEVEGNP